MDPAVNDQHANPADSSAQGQKHSSGLTQDMIDKILAAGKNAKVKAYLNILNKITTGEKVTMADVRTMEAIKKELEEAALLPDQGNGSDVSGLTGPSLAPLKNILSVHAHILASGYKASKSVVYKHYNEGKIPMAKDGTFAVVEVERYASTYLKRKDGSQVVSPEVADLQQKRAAVDLERAEIDRDSERLKLDKLKGSLVPSSLLEEELGRRAQLFRSDGETFWHATAPQIVLLVAGDQEKIPDLIEFGLAAEDDRLARYAAAPTAMVHDPMPPEQIGQPPSDLPDSNYKDVSAE